MNERCSTLLLNRLPSKEKDLGSFTIPCQVSNLRIDNALADLGASISLMPYTMYEKLGLGEPKPTRMSLELADRSIQYPRGIVENVLIKVEKFVLPIDFVILDMPENSRIPIILGRPFLATAQATIDRMIECYGIDDLDVTIGEKTQEILEDNWSDSFEEIKDKKGAKNLAADHLSRLENPNTENLAEEDIADKFPVNHLMMLKEKLIEAEPWYADYINYLVGKVIPLNWTLERRKWFYSQLEKKFWKSWHIATLDQQVDTTAPQARNISSRNKMPQNNIQVAVDYVSKQVEAQTLPTNDARVVVKFLRSLFARFRVPKALISDRGTHFCNSQLEKALQKYEVHYRVSIAYHPQSNGQTEVTNRSIKRILKRSIG
ncbi:reverse transcriptase domain-containing protein [Tanacetum coccineum]